MKNDVRMKRISLAILIGLFINASLYAGPNLAQVEANLTDAILKNNQIEYARSILDLHALSLGASTENSTLQNIINANGTPPIALDLSGGVAAIIPYLEYFTMAASLGSGVAIYQSQDSNVLQF